MTEDQQPTGEVELTRGQKAAQTRARNRAKKAREAKKARNADTFSPIEGFEVQQPPVGSIILAHGKTGTAIQRHSDGNYYAAGSTEALTFGEVLTLPNLVFVYSPPA